MGIVRSMLLYGSPVWAGDLRVSRLSKKVLRRLQRRLAIRVVRRYRTLSHEAASALAGILPFGLQAEADATVYQAVGAVLASWDSWLDRGHGRHTYRLTQVLTGHGCFGEYLCRIGREATARCHHCDAERDTAQHTLEEWELDQEEAFFYRTRPPKPPSWSSEPLPFTEELAERARHQPYAALGAETLEESTAVERVAGASSGLKASLQRCLL
ncbi:uncharacterized protein LOC105697777 [Orussus abietinus]|uniref:uncharacterized protein LOC105697777 n=1 Tax=Orussus abietinus TaxID=222816 RepID=UPI000624F452|nr:uncharacterized protein LOC105697777 [Orussus abietinus]